MPRRRRYDDDHDDDACILRLSLPAIDPSTNGKVFVPPSPRDTPDSLFEAKKSLCTVPTFRYIRRDNRYEGLVYIDGCCLNNGREDARAGYSVVHFPHPDWEEPGAVVSRLENEGADGRIYQQTSNRAELRAAIVALQLRYWPGEGFSRFVIATDSEYVVKGATEWVRKWQRNNWMTAQGTPAKNRDLWELLLKELDKWSERGMTVLFWHIPRELNTLADHFAKQGALLDPEDKFMPQIVGIIDM